jgi:hypothetical protein
MVSVTPGEWQRRALGDGPLDGGVLGGVVNGNTVIVHGTSDGRLVSWTRSDGEFVRSDIAVADGLVIVFDLAPFGGSAVLVGSDFEGLPRLWTSTDGTAWTDVVTTGFDQPADVLALSASPEALYAAGGLRDGTGGPAVRPAIWRSTDGAHWDFVTPPETPANGAVRDVVAGPGGVIVAMQAEGRGSIWRSVDDGLTLSPATVELDSAPFGWMVESIARLDERLVGVGTLIGDTGPTLLSLVSFDDGVTWTSPPDDGAAPGGDGFGSRVVAAAGAFWISMSEHNNAFSNPEACYRDLSSCQAGSRPVLLRSSDGLEWVEIDLDALSTSWIESVVDVAEQGVMLVGSSGGTVQLETWTWPSDAEPPRRPPPPEQPADEPPLVSFDGDLTIGATYRFPLFIHCGMGLLGNFNDRWWFLVAGSTDWDPESDPAEAAPAHWPIAEQSIFGTITLVDADTIEYSIPSGEVIAVYEASTTVPELCA